MKKLLLTFLLGAAAPLVAQTWTEKYADLGQVILVKLDTAPFPHPDRAQGHKYQDKFFSAEKNYSDNSVGIFVPKGFKPAGRVDFVVHFHGWQNHVENVFSHYELARQFADSGRNAILVVPQGPLDAQDSFDGKLEDENGFKRFMADVMKTLRDRGVIADEPVGEIILSGHSGGYQVMSSIVARGGLTDHVKEVWLFDALYARTEKFMDWWKTQPGVRLIDIYTANGGTKNETEKLMATLAAQKTPLLVKKEREITPADLRDNRLIFIFTDLAHDDVVAKRKAFCEYLKTSRLAAIPAAK